jgi:hypothetical protein
MVDSSYQNYIEHCPLSDVCSIYTTPEMSHILNIPYKMGCIQYNYGVKYSNA